MDGYYNDNKTCKKCDDNCLTCETTATNCLTCTKYLFNSKCVTECESNYFVTLDGA